MKNLMKRLMVPIIALSAIVTLNSFVENNEDSKGCSCDASSKSSCYVNCPCGGSITGTGAGAIDC